MKDCSSILNEMDCLERALPEAEQCVSCREYASGVAAETPEERAALNALQRQEILTEILTNGRVVCLHALAQPCVDQLCAIIVELHADLVACGEREEP